MLAAVIVEYNPLHNGHIYHLQKTAEILARLAPNEDNNIIAIMSGDFTQRGDIALLNKYTRAELAILAGVDMVIELPATYATSAAQYFAAGAMQIAAKISGLGLITFGAECDDITKLTEAAAVTEDSRFDELVQQYSSQGLSYPKCAELAANNLSKTDTKWLFTPNNILAVEYIRQAKKLALGAQLMPIKRVGGGYNQAEFDDNFNSATAVRQGLANGITDAATLKIPNFTAQKLLHSKVDYDRFFAIIASKCLHADSVYEDNEGIINRIKKYSQTAENYEQLVELCHTKRYTKSKIKRILTHVALGHTDKVPPPIGKPNILAIAEDKRQLLSRIDFSGDDEAILQNKYADKIYNIVSSDKIKDNDMIIVNRNMAT